MAFKMPWWGWLAGAGVAGILLSGGSASASTVGVAPGRSPDQLLSVVAQIDPEHNPTLQAAGGVTYCNMFIEQATGMLGVGLDNMSANDHYAWFQDNGQANGWNQVSEDTAGSLANQGAPVVAIWQNPGGHGHMGLIIPGQPDPYNGLPMAQAGAHNFNGSPDAGSELGYKYVKNGFGNFGPVEYWAHA